VLFTRGGNAFVIFTDLPLSGAVVVDLEYHHDQRGVFRADLDVEIAAERGLARQFVQTSIPWNPRAGTLRGMHWQAAPHQEVKLVRVTAGMLLCLVKPQRSALEGW
jgi:dTDP-4-dehydrorhamnose 3,5-epimerase